MHGAEVAAGQGGAYNTGENIGSANFLGDDKFEIQINFSAMLPLL